MVFDASFWYGISYFHIVTAFNAMAQIIQKVLAKL